MSPFSFARLGLIFVSVVGLAGAELPSVEFLAPAPRPPKWVFSLAPRSFQGNPQVELSVITEMTEEGRNAPTPSLEAPIYFVAQSSGFHAEGHGAQSPGRIEVAQLEEHLRQALSSRGYRPAVEGHPPTLALFFVWGMHNRLNPEYDDVGYRNLLSRAKLVGGAKFASKLFQVLDEASLSVAPANGIGNPLHQFVETNNLTRQLIEQTFNDCYYIVVSAYDGASLAGGERKLLWRTKMSTLSQGLGLRETLPVLIAGGGPYFGQEMPMPVVVDKQLHRWGKVEVGESQVKEYLPPTGAREEEKKR